MENELFNLWSNCNHCRLKAPKLKCEHTWKYNVAETKWVITLGCIPCNYDKYLFVSFPLHNTLLHYRHLKWELSLFSLEKGKLQHDPVAACITATRRSSRRWSQALLGTVRGEDEKKQWGLSSHKMLRLPMRTVKQWGRFPIEVARSLSLRGFQDRTG